MKMPPSAIDSFRARLEDKTASIGVVGLGYVGLPLACEFSPKGFSVAAFEKDPVRLRSLKAWRSYTEYVSSEELRKLRRLGKLKATAGASAMTAQDVLIICVQTPLRKTQEPDMTPLVSALNTVSRRLRKGQLVSIESTTWPGATEEIALPILESSGLKVGRDFHLAFSPERIDPGNRAYRISNTPKVVGGITPACAAAGAALYAEVVDRVVRVSSARAAEFVKLLENSFRAVNIALVNEIAQVCRRLGLEVWEIIEAAATKPFGFMPFAPGPGIGGHCIPKDPKLLAWRMRSLNFNARFIELAADVNASMPGYVAERIAATLNESKRPLKGSRVLVLGVAYKPDVADIRESPALDVIDLLLRKGAVVSYHDPHVPRLSWGGRVLKNEPLTHRSLSRADLAAVLTAHTNVDYDAVARFSRVVFDARNAMRGRACKKLATL